MSLRFHLLILLTALLLAGAAGAADWPQIRGPERDGRSPETGLLPEWPADGPRVIWRQPIGEAFSAVAAAGGRLYTGTSDAEKEYAVALDPATGGELWRRELGPVFTHEFGNGPRATPTVDGDVVYLLSARGRLAALAAADGATVWQVDLGEAFGAEQPRFGWAGSALIDGDLLLTETGGPEGKGLGALDKRTGEVRWTVLDGPAAYSSPVVATFGGVRQILFFRRSSPEIVSLLPDGKVFWTHPGLTAVVTMPLVVPPDGVFLSTTHDAEGFLLRVGVKAGQPVVEEAWRSRKMKNHFNSSVVVDGHIYGFDNATFKCLDAATGEQTWAHRGFGKGSLIAADGRLIVLSDFGLAALVEATPEAYREAGHFQATTGKAWTPPSLAGGTLYVRDQDEIAAFALGGGAAAAEKSTVGATP